jgi:hypothetical protein
MQNLEKPACNSFIVSECALNNKIRKISILQCCEVLIDFRTCLLPPPEPCHDIKVTSCVEVKIDKVCGCKVLLGGILHKTIKYYSLDKHGKACKHVKRKDIPFSCYVDFDCASLEDTFKIAGHEVIGEFSEIKKIKEDYTTKTIFIEKDIIKVSVQCN